MGGLIITANIKDPRNKSIEFDFHQAPEKELFLSMVIAVT